MVVTRALLVGFTVAVKGFTKLKLYSDHDSAFSRLSQLIYPNDEVCDCGEIQQHLEIFSSL